MAKKAVLVGCNYPNTQYQLHGCINDVVSMQELLVNRFGFDPKSIEILVDEGSDSKVLPTGLNIRNALKKMIDEAKVGDVLFFHYSGHGTLIPTKHHLVKHDEAIVPTDFNLITDVDFRELVNKLPKGASFTILSDSCHSGGLISKEKEQIGPNTLPISARSKNIDSTHLKPKQIPFQSLMDYLSILTYKVEFEIGAYLITLFGDNASLKFRLSETDLNQWLGPQSPDSGILLSGCQSNETSADLPPSGANGKAHGAFSYAIQSVLKAQQGPLSNKEVVMLSREVLMKEGLETQHPCLYCSDENANAPFLMWKQ